MWVLGGGHLKVLVEGLRVLGAQGDVGRGFRVSRGVSEGAGGSGGCWGGSVGNGGVM